jgi:hypothetical protein
LRGKARRRKEKMGGKRKCRGEVRSGKMREE